MQYELRGVGWAQVWAFYLISGYVLAEPGTARQAAPGLAASHAGRARSIGTPACAGEAGPQSIL